AVAAVQHDVGIGAVAGAQGLPLQHVHGGADLELDGAVHLHAFGGDVFQLGIPAGAVDGAHGDHHGHAQAHLAHLAFVHVALEDLVGHVGHGGDGGAIVEVVALDHAAAHLHGHVQHHAGNGAPHDGVAGASAAVADAVAHQRQRVLRGVLF